MLPLQSTQACGRAGFCEKILRFSPAAQPKILGFFLWLNAKAPSMQACVLFHSRIYFLYIDVFYNTPPPAPAKVKTEYISFCIKIRFYFFLFLLMNSKSNKSPAAGRRQTRERRNLGRDKIEHSEILSQGHPGGFLSLFAVAGTRCRGFVMVHRNIKICKKNEKNIKK